MTAKRRDLADLPDWPRLMSREQAAAYCGLSPNCFEAHVGTAAVRLGGRKLYDRKGLDAWLDSLARPGDDRRGDHWVEAFDAGQNQGRAARPVARQDLLLSPAEPDAAQGALRQR